MNAQIPYCAGRCSGLSSLQQYRGQIQPLRHFRQSPEGLHEIIQIRDPRHHRHFDFDNLRYRRCDPREKLLKECGPPSDVESWDEERFEYFDRPPPSRLYNEFERYGNAYRVRAWIQVELWTYNYGPSRFIDYVRLENGIVRRIYSGGYGY